MKSSLAFAPLLLSFVTAVSAATAHPLLLCDSGNNRVCVLSADGKIEWQHPATHPQECWRKPTGNYLFCFKDGALEMTPGKVIELGATEKVVWELNENDLPGHPLRLMAGCQRLPNGNTVFVNYLGHGHAGEQPSVIEVTRDKQVVWSLNDTNSFKAVSQIQLLDVRGDVTKGEILR